VANATGVPIFRAKGQKVTVTIKVKASAGGPRTAAQLVATGLTYLSIVRVYAVTADDSAFQLCTMCKLVPVNDGSCGGWLGLIVLLLACMRYSWFD